MTVARFLQSIDTDGDLSNGIQITGETIAVLTKALQQENIETVPNTTTELETVVSHIEQEDGNFSGHVVTEEEAQNHLQATQLSVLNELLAGKTFYVPGIDGENTKILVKVVVNNNATSATWNWIEGPVKSGTITVKIQGNMIIAENPQEFLGQTADYLKIIEHHKDGHTVNARWYYSEAKAQEYLKSL